ncbi:2,3-butanediol dehydrogenase [Domibacillus aminovorans]|uniref:Butanediol dehydrogenase n=1 Tax=Domibacillus aminovorans TaxID=29332 RepID=A0A177L7A0_9BACI|nr:2,3-butanediol dehydrogenase [Domibacillus aminovorans]OAH61227.1 butanediol dehydrogenase [Domibacillus aminovorans]
MRAAVWYGLKDIRVEEREISNVSSDQVKVKVAWAGICGSDLHEYAAGPSIIPVYNDPLTGQQAPLTMGHEFSGVVEEVGSNVHGLKEGDKVAINPLIISGTHNDPLVDMYKGFAFVGLNSDGGFADFVVVDEKNVVKLPENMSLEQAALIEPTAVTVQAIKESQMKFGESVAVFGAGPIGLLTIISAKAAGAKEIFAFDLSETRLQKAKEVGATHVINSGEKDPVEYIRSIYPDGVDRAFEVAGVAPTFNQAIEVTRARGIVTIVALYEKPVNFEPMKLTASGVHIVSTLAYEPDVFEDTVKLMASGQLDPTPVITDHIELEEIVNKGFEALINDKSQAKILVKLSGE